MPSFIQPTLIEVTTGPALSSTGRCKDLKGGLLLARVESKRAGGRDQRNVESGRPALEDHVSHAKEWGLDPEG